MASCVAVPTLTTAQVSTSQSLVTTSTQSISTAPGSVSTVVLSTCAQLQSSSQCQPTITTSFITLPGSTATVNVPATLTVNVPVTVLITLFGSSCHSSSNSLSTSSTSTFTSASASTPLTSALTSTDTSSPTTTAPLPVIVTTPSPTVVTTSSLVTSDGSTFISLFTSTSTFPATTLQAQSTSSPSDKRVAVGPVVGGVVGGLAALLLLGLLTWRLVKKQSRFDDFFNPDGDGPRPTLPLLEKPSYQYGIVGQPSSNPISVEPLHSPPAVQTSFSNIGATGQGQGLSTNGQTVIGNDGNIGQASSQASGQVSGGGLGQASGPPGTLGTNSGLGQTVAGGHGVIGNLPPISHTGNLSPAPLIAGIGTAVAASGVYATAASSRPSSSRPSSGSSSQALGPPVTPANPQGSYPPGLQNRNVSYGYGQAHAGTSDGPGQTKLSVSSTASGPSAYNRSSWIGSSSTNYNAGDNSGSLPPALPSMAASSHQPQHHRRTSYGPVAPNNTNYEYQRHPEIGSSSSSMGGGAASSSQEAPLYDEQGRPSNMPPEKAPLVHLDGSLYQQPPRGGSSQYEPPAYIE